jgi:hypothetical protein
MKNKMEKFVWLPSMPTPQGKDSQGCRFSFLKLKRGEIYYGQWINGFS